MAKRYSSKPLTSRPATPSPMAPVLAGASDGVTSVPGYFSRRWLRRAVSILLLGYLSIVLLGPLSNPVGSEFLTRPLARFVAPIHRLLFLGHGYRFFGPDPGPSHLLVYRIVDAEGELVEKRFPDRKENWPRLMYHRWFMLSETLFQEHNGTMDQASFDATDKELERQVEELKLRGKRAIAERITAERQQLAIQYRNARERIDQLVFAVAKHLLQRHQASHIEMFLQERSIPYPAAVLTGEKINDTRFLSDLRKIGEFRADDRGVVISVGRAPEPEAANAPNSPSESAPTSTRLVTPARAGEGE